MKLKNRLKKYWKQSGWFLMVLLSTMAALLIVVLDQADAPPLPKGDVVEMKEGWTYTDPENGGRQLTDLPVNLNLPASQTIHIENIFPETMESGMFLCFRSTQQSVRVFVSGKQVYEYDMSGSRLFSRATPSAWNFVPVPAGSAGETVAIETVSPYTQSSGQLNRVFYGPYSAVELNIMKMQVPQFIISMAMIMQALTLFLASFCLMKSKELRHVLHSLSFFIFLAGVWAFGESRMPNPFSFFNLMESPLSFYALFLLPMPYLDYMSFRLHPRRRRALSILYGITFANTVVCTVLQVLKVADLIELLPAAHIMIVLAAGYTLLSLLYDSRGSGGDGSRLELAGLIILSFCAVEELGLFYKNDFSNIGIWVPLGLLIYLMLLSLSTVRNLMRRSAEADELDRKLRENQGRLLISQIQPHFIYNTLGAIQAYIMKSPNTAYKMVQDFSDYLRANIQSVTNTDPIPFTAELKHVRAYTDIELIRFRNRIQVIYEIGASDFMILPLTIQPLVENAIKHGLCKKVEGGTVWIRTREHENDFAVIVEDDGIGFDVLDIKKKSDSVGLRNIRDRLTLQMDAAVDIASAPGRGTRVTIIIPRGKALEQSIQK